MMSDYKGRSFRYLVIFMIISGAFATIMGTGNDENEKQCLNYSASGNYIYNPSTKELSVVVEESNFPGDSGIEGEYTVTSIAETFMTWKDSKGVDIEWQREHGVAEDIIGLWTEKVDNVAYVLNFNSVNTFTLDGGACF